jgi:hypothetical protein
MNKDQWLEAVVKKTFRSEKEVENKFVLHLLSFFSVVWLENCLLATIAHRAHLNFYSLKGIKIF